MKRKYIKDKGSIFNTKPVYQKNNVTSRLVKIEQQTTSIKNSVKNIIEIILLIMLLVAIISLVIITVYHYATIPHLFKIILLNLFIVLPTIILPIISKL